MFAFLFCVFFSNCLQFLRKFSATWFQVVNLLVLFCKINFEQMKCTARNFCNFFFSLHDRDKSQDGWSSMVFENFKAGSGLGNYPLKTSRQKQQRIHRASCKDGVWAGIKVESKSQSLGSWSSAITSKTTSEQDLFRIIWEWWVDETWGCISLFYFSVTVI